MELMVGFSPQYSSACVMALIDSQPKAVNGSKPPCEGIRFVTRVVISVSRLEFASRLSLTDSSGKAGWKK